MLKPVTTAALLLLCIGRMSADDQIITLDLTKASPALEFDATNGSWTGTYDDDEESIESQCFSFVHSSMGDYDTWWGFTASNSADNSKPANTLTQQWSNMAKGGIVLNEDGTVKTDEYGAPVVSADVPYIVGYYNAYMGRRPNDMTFNDGLSYDPQGVYVNLNSWAYYTIIEGDALCRAFTNGDKFTLTIHGVAPDESETSVDVLLASADNGDQTVNRGWKYVDLTPLGTVNELYFTMTSTDSGLYGMNTPGYFCLDKLSVKPSDSSSLTGLMADSTAIISYDRANKTVNVSGADFTIISNTAGQNVMSGDCRSFDLTNLPAGVYVVRAGSATLKIAK